MVTVSGVDRNRGQGGADRVHVTGAKVGRPIVINGRTP